MRKSKEMILGVQKVGVLKATWYPSTIMMAVHDSMATRLHFDNRLILHWYEIMVILHYKEMYKKFIHISSFKYQGNSICYKKKLL